MPGKSPYPGLNPPTTRGAPAAQSVEYRTRHNESQHAHPHQLEGENSSAYPRLGEDHPEGRPKTGQAQHDAATTAAAQRDLNFGWFSVPIGDKNDRGRTPSRQSGQGEGVAQPNSDGSHVGPGRSASRSSSKNRLMEPPQCAGASMDPLMNPQDYNNPGQAADRVADPNHGIAGTAGPGGPPQQQTFTDDYEWPLSFVARGQRAYQQQVEQQTQRFNNNRPPSRQSDVPPTPMPPVSLSGYGEGARPTYKTWSEYWHNSQGRPGGPSRNTNNSSHATMADYYPDPYYEEEANPEVGEEMGVVNRASEDAILSDIYDELIDLNAMPPREKSVSDCSLSSRMFGTPDLESSRERFVHCSPCSFGTAERYMPALVMEWTDVTEETTPQNKDRSKGHNLLKAMRSQFDAVIASLKCWPAKIRLFTTRKANPYKKFRDSQKSKKEMKCGDMWEYDNN